MQKGLGLLTLHRGEVVEEFLETRSVLEVLDQGPHRNARPGKDRRPAENIRIAMKDRVAVHATAQFGEIHEVRRPLNRR